MDERHIESRRGIYDYLQYVDCGRQDAWGIRHGRIKRLDNAYKHMAGDV